jgi:serine/threonine-protein kinase
MTPDVSNTQALAANLPPVTPGTVLAGKYRVERIIGQGGMGIVVEARHIALDERVALKFLLPDYAMHPEAAARFLREARAAVKIKSEHVARVSDVGTLDTNAPYMVMEFLEGDDLSKILENRGMLGIQEAIDYIIQGCEAIAEAHSHGIVHRDLKPANLFLTRRQDGFPLVKVLDFGISKTMGNNVENLTKTMAAMGSALYMSPEQMQQTRSVDHRTDIYALGISLYELLAGKQPFYAETLPQLCAEILTGTPTPLRQVRNDVSEQLATVIERAYARDRAARYQSVAEFVVALAPFAPAASRGTIERVARMGGLQLGAEQQRSSSPQLPPAGGTAALPPGVPANAQPVGSGSGPIVLGPYQAPASARASAAFALGGSTNANLSTTGTGTQRSGKGAIIATVVAGLLTVGAIVAFLALRKGGSESGKDGHAAQPADTAAQVAAPPSGAAVTPPPSAAPKDAASGAAAPPTATASATAEAPPPTATATAAVAAPAAPPRTGRRGPAPPAKTAEAAKPAEAPKPAAKPVDLLAPPPTRGDP